ncbi:MAG TPA: ATP-binding protein [Rubrivivax sp.]|nr:ATP-binding protein [Rubrivivax sp.]
MSDSAASRVFRARHDQVAAALAFVEDFCALRQVGADDASRLMLVVEELFTNVIVHGHRGDSDAPVHVELGVAAAQLTLYFEDSAPPFDPLRHLAESAPDLDQPAHERLVGGLGLPLVARMCERFDYAHVDGRNRLRLVLGRAG